MRYVIRRIQICGGITPTGIEVFVPQQSTGFCSSGVRFAPRSAKHFCQEPAMVAQKLVRSSVCFSSRSSYHRAVAILALFCAKPLPLTASPTRVACTISASSSAPPLRLNISRALSLSPYAIAPVSWKSQLPVHRPHRKRHQPCPQFCMAILTDLFNLFPLFTQRGHRTSTISLGLRATCVSPPPSPPALHVTRRHPSCPRHRRCTFCAQPSSADVIVSFK